MRQLRMNYRDDFVGANGFIDIRVGAPRGFNGYQNRGLSSGSKADVVTGFLVPTERSETRQVDGRTGCCITRLSQTPR